MTELKRCPECGRKMKIDYKFRPLRYAIVHASPNAFMWTDKCYGGTDYEYETEEDAIKAWNSEVGDD